MDSNRETRHSGMYILRMYERDAFLTQSRGEVVRRVYAREESVAGIDRTRRPYSVLYPV